MGFPKDPKPCTRCSNIGSLVYGYETGITCSLVTKALRRFNDRTDSPDLTSPGRQHLRLRLSLSVFLIPSHRAIIATHTAVTNFFTTVASTFMFCHSIEVRHNLTPMVESKTLHGSGGGAPVSSDTLEQAALKVLQEGDPWRKAQYGDLAATLWLQGAMRIPYEVEGPLLVVPSRPARLDIVSLWSFWALSLVLNWGIIGALSYGFAINCV